MKSSHANEVDRMLTVYTQKLGKINVSAKGVKKTGSKLRYSIEPVSCVGLILVEGKNFLILKDAIILDQFLGIKKDLQKMKTIGRICDLIDEAIAGEEKDEDIWKLIVLTFTGIEKGKILLNTAVSDFSKNLIRLLGYDPQEIKNLKEIY